MPTFAIDQFASFYCGLVVTGLIVFVIAKARAQAEWPVSIAN